MGPQDENKFIDQSNSLSLDIDKLGPIKYNTNTVNKKTDIRKIIPRIETNINTFVEQIQLQDSEDQNLKDQDQNQDNKTCTCPKNNCIANYCICYQKGIICKPTCKCAGGCKNTIGNFKYNEERRKKTGQNKPKSGCNCQNNNCMKNYCTCKKVNKRCGAECSCKGCENPFNESDKDG